MLESKNVLHHWGQRWVVDPLNHYSMACILNILRSSNDASRIIIIDFRVMLRIEASLTNNSRGIINNPRYIINIHLWCLLYNNHWQWPSCGDCNMFKVQAGNTKGEYHCNIDLLFDWFGSVCLANNKKLSVVMQLIPTVKQEVNSTVIFPPLVFPARGIINTLVWCL